VHRLTTPRRPAYDPPLHHETSTWTPSALSRHSADAAVTVFDFDRRNRVRRLVRLSETGERVGGDRHDEVTHGDVEVGPRRHEVEGCARIRTCGTGSHTPSCSSSSSAPRTCCETTRAGDGSTRSRRRRRPGI